MFATGAVVLMPGLWLLFAALENAAVVIANDQAITARTLFGRLRQIAWTEIAVVKRKKNQIILSPAGIDYNRPRDLGSKSVFLDIGTLCAAPGEFEALVGRHRPDLIIPPAA